VTLVVADEGGHETTDTVLIEVQDYFVFREGSVDVEDGNSNSSLFWHGASVTPLNCTIYQDETLVNSFSWNGTQIELDLQTLQIGTHELSFQLHNGSEIIHDDTFSVTVHPPTPPIIISRPAIQEIAWNQEMVFQWEVLDYSPVNWSIIDNDTLIGSGTAYPSRFNINWAVFSLDEGIHNVTLVLEDQTGYLTVEKHPKKQ
jgi:hypothetical protein